MFSHLPKCVDGFADRLSNMIRTTTAPAQVCCGLVFLICFGRFASSEAFIDKIYNSDTLVVSLFADNLAAGNLSLWQATTPIFWFPDYAVYLFFHFLLDGDVGWAMTATAYSFGVGGVCGWIYFLRGVFDDNARVHCAVLLTAAAVYFLATESAFEVLEFAVAPNWHGGAFIMLPYCLRLFWDFAEKSARLPLLLPVLLILTAASDPILFLWFCFPCGAYLLLKRNIQLVAKGGALFVGCAAAAFACRRLIANFVYYDIVSVNNHFTFFPAWLELFVYLFVESLGEYTVFRTNFFVFKPFLAHVADVFKLHAMVALPALLSAGVLCVCAFFAETRARRAARLLLLVAAAGGSPMLVAHFFNNYYITPMWLTCLFAAVPLFLLLRFVSPKKINVLCCVFFAAVTMTVGVPKQANAIARYYPPKYACLDDNIRKHNISRGLSLPRLARRMEHLTKSNIQLFSVLGDFTPAFWLNNIDRAHGDDFNFVAVKTDGKEEYYAYLDLNYRDIFLDAPPVAEFSCEDITVYVYPDFSYTHKVCGDLSRLRKISAEGADLCLALFSDAAPSRQDSE